MSPLDPVMDYPDADLKVPSQFFDGKFFGSLQNRCWDFVAITNPIDHAIGERLAFGAAQLRLIECRGDVQVGHRKSQGSDLGNDRLGLENVYGRGHTQLYLKIYNRAPMPA